MLMTSPDASTRLLPLAMTTSVIARSDATGQRKPRHCEERSDEAISWQGENGGEKMARLTGKVALITGAAGGQGAAEAELFVREEAAVILTDIDGAAGESLAQRLAGEGGKVLFLRQDVADEGSWKEVVAAAFGRF